LPVTAFVASVIGEIGKTRLL